MIKINNKNKSNLKCFILTAIHWCFTTSLIVSRVDGSTDNILEIRVFASFDTLSHSGLGKSYCPVFIRFFIPGEIACPWLLKKGGNPHNLKKKYGYYANLHKKNH